MGKVALYWNTIKYMKPSQVYYRIIKKLGLKCTIGCTPNTNYKDVISIKIPFEFDNDPVFLERFNADEFLNDKVTFLHSSKKFFWNEKWEFEDQSALWNFNLHYFEYLFSMISAYKKTGNKEYFDKTIFCVNAWIDQNPVGEGIGWSPYTIDLRLTNWISYYCITEKNLPTEFKLRMIESIYEQYVYLSKHIEKDILGNHYFEDLKTLILCSLFFQDNQMLQASLKAFKEECKEEILPDGMHFELSPMYHKIVFEGLLRVTIALRGNGIKEIELEKLIQPMLDVAWSFEEGLERIPLFNDCGNNIAKSLSSFVEICKSEFGIVPKFKSILVDSGFYIYKWDKWKMIVDAGQVGPSYIPGHAHCDAMSFELFKEGKPVLVNCGTYAYQCEKRNFFRSTSAHNTVMLNGGEQSEFWGDFRLAKRSKVNVLSSNKNSITIEMEDQKRVKIKRIIKFIENTMIIEDLSYENNLKSYIHIPKLIGENMCDFIIMDEGSQMSMEKQPYSVEYGKLNVISAATVEAKNRIKIMIDLEKIPV